MTVASSGEGATLDGQRSTGLFKLENGCSLTLRGLTLVNGRASNGGVVLAFQAGDVEIIDSTIKNCSADVRRVAAAPLAAPHGSGQEMQTRRQAARPAASHGREARDEGGPSLLPNPARLSQPQAGGVVRAYYSGPVSLIGSTVTSCSAGYVRRVELAARPAAPPQQWVKRR